MPLFFTLRGNFGADSNKFGPCPSHALRLIEIQRIKRIAIVGDSIVPPAAFIMGTNLHRFDRFPWRPTPLQKRFDEFLVDLIIVLSVYLRVSGFKTCSDSSCDDQEKWLVELDVTVRLQPDCCIHMASYSIESFYSF